MNSMARPRRARMSSSRLTTCAWIETSSAETGSSATSRFGRRIRARAMPMRWRWPPENSCGKRSAAACGQPDQGQRLRHAGGARLAAERRVHGCSSGAPTICSTRMRGLSEAYGVLEDQLHVAAERAQSAGWSDAVMSVPSKRMVPALAAVRRSTQRPTVVLPDPLSPTRPSTSPRPMAKDDAVDRAHRQAAAGKQAAADAVVLAQAAQFEQRGGHAAAMARQRAQRTVRRRSDLFQRRHAAVAGGGDADGRSAGQRRSPAAWPAGPARCRGWRAARPAAAAKSSRGIDCSRPIVYGISGCSNKWQDWTLPRPACRHTSPAPGRRFRPPRRDCG